MVSTHDKRPHRWRLAPLVPCCAVAAVVVVLLAGPASSQSAKTKLPADVETILADKPCFTCHSVGELGGGKLGPNLRIVGQRRSAAWLRTWLADPRSVKKDTMMPAGLLTDAEIGTMAKFLAAQKTTVDVDKVFEAHDGAAAEVGKALFGSYDCGACHKIGGTGGNLANTGPDLAGVNKRYDGEYLRAWLQDPGKVKKDTFMPKYGVSEREIDALVAYLEKL